MASSSHTPAYGIFEPARRSESVGLVFLDLDDTIVQGGLHVSPRVAQALRASHAAGVKLAVASGRCAHMLQAGVTELGLIDYYLCSNGAMLYDSCFQPLERRLLASADILEIMDALEPLGCGWNCFVGGAAYMELRNVTYMASGPARRSALAKSSPLSMIGSIAREVVRGATRSTLKHSVRSARPYIERSSFVEKVGCSFPSEEAADRGLALLREHGGFEVARIWAREFEITAKGVTKGRGARRVLELASIARDAAVAFGDSANDLPIREAVGRFVAVANASEEVLAVADETCPSVWDDGVAAWLESHVLTGKGA